MHILPALLILALAGLTRAHIGNLTRYDPSAAIGTCGWQNKPNEMVVALSAQTMGNGANPVKNPKCGQEIEIFNPANGKRAKAVITDTCPSCAAASIAVTPAVHFALSTDPIIVSPLDTLAPLSADSHITPNPDPVVDKYKNTDVDMGRIENVVWTGTKLLKLSARS